MERIRVRLSFYGRVQGVGFRYTAYHSAIQLRLTGWVRNEYDGSVTAEIQGTEAEIDRWEGMLSRDRYIVIEDVVRKQLPVEPEEGDFEIRD